MWRLTLYHQSPGGWQNEWTEVRLFKTHRGAVQSGNYWMKRDDTIREWSAKRVD